MASLAAFTVARAGTRFFHAQTFPVVIDIGVCAFAKGTERFFVSFDKLFKSFFAGVADKIFEPHYLSLPVRLMIK